MKLTFDIDQDELPIFLAETDEQLQILDEGLVELEQRGDDEDLVQAVFRAAHTLKGAAGMIGHLRMVTITHALENILDELRKGEIDVSTGFIDMCLEAVDGLRQLKDEVVSGETSDLDIDMLAGKFSEFDFKGEASGQEKIETESESDQKFRELIKDIDEEDHAVIQAKISQTSAASAARAMQIILAIQNYGEIVKIFPSQEEIETAKPVHELIAVFKTSSPLDEVEESIKLIGDLESYSIDFIKDSEYSTSHIDLSENAQLASIEIEIAKSSAASAARAFQLFLAIQEMGVIQKMEPNQAEIETAKPVYFFRANFTTDLDADSIRQKIDLIDEVVINSLQINGQTLEDRPAAKSVEKEKEQVQENDSKTDDKLVKRVVKDKMIRTSVERMDNLMNLVGELITDRNRLNQIRTQYEARFHGDEQVEFLSETISHIARITDQLQNEVMGIRMSPVSNLFHKFPRMIRDLAKKFNKSVDLIIEGEDTELDRTVIDEISDPMIHILRNAVDHAIESPEERRKVGKPEKAKILLDARHEEGRITISVQDDGKGIDVAKVKNKAVKKGLISESEAKVISNQEAVNLIFNSGLSTAAKVSDISGRGVGLDIVRNNIQKLNGTVTVESWPGEGTRFEINLPLTLAIVPTLLVKVSTCILAVPLITVSTTLRIGRQQIKTVNRVNVFTYRDSVIPLLNLRKVFKIDEDSISEEEFQHVVVVGSGEQKVGLVVDRLLGQEEVVVKSIGVLVGDVYGIASAAILGDGQIALIVDVQDLFRYSK